MKAHDMNGAEFDITREEAERIAEELAHIDGKETNKTFTDRALDNIEAVTGIRPKTEDELKELLYKNLAGPSMAEIELIYESMEVIVGWHSMKTRTM